MRKARGLVAVILAVLVLAMMVAPAAAKPGHGRRLAYGKNKFQLQGVVKAVAVSTDSAVPSTITVTVKSGTRTVKQFRGQDLTMNVSAGAKILLENPDGTNVPITLDQIVVGSKVHVGGKINRAVSAPPVYWANKIIVQEVPVVTDAPAIPELPAP